VTRGIHRRIIFGSTANTRKNIIRERDCGGGFNHKQTQIIIIGRLRGSIVFGFYCFVDH
jgi:hypothetical protein